MVLCDYSDAYILAKETITVANTGTSPAPNNADKNVIFKNCASCTACISRINNTLINNAEYIDVVMPMYHLIEYRDNYSKTSRVLWQFCKDVPTVDTNGAITNLTEANAATDSFNRTVKLTSQTGNKGTRNVRITVQ